MYLGKQVTGTLFGLGQNVELLGAGRRSRRLVRVCGCAMEELCSRKAFLYLGQENLRVG